MKSPKEITKYDICFDADKQSWERSEIQIADVLFHWDKLVHREDNASIMKILKDKQFKNQKFMQ